MWTQSREDSAITEGPQRRYLTPGIPNPENFQSEYEREEHASVAIIDGVQECMNRVAYIGFPGTDRRRAAFSPPQSLSAADLNTAGREV